MPRVSAVFDCDPAGFVELAAWAGGVAPEIRIGIEGSASYGAPVAARRVHEVGAALHLPDKIVVEEVLGLGMQRRVDCHDVAHTHERGTIRWFSATEREGGLARIEAIARGVGEALRVQIEFDVLGGAPVTSNVPECAALVEEAVTESGRATLIDGGRITATDDVAYLLDIAPGAFFLVGTGGPSAVPHHHPAFEIDERAIGLMTEILARAAIKVLHHTAGESVGA